MRKAIFLDRDGVINDLVYREGGWYSPRRACEFVLSPGISNFCTIVRRLKFDIIVVTNQPDLARGFLPQPELQEMHNIVTEKLGIQEILVCPHDTSQKCICRKPSPYLLKEAISRHSIDPSLSFMIGDRLTDAYAGRDAGVFPVIVKSKQTEDLSLIESTFLYVNSLDEVLSFLISKF